MSERTVSPNVMVVVGTRPEAIKLAPVVLRLREVAGLMVRLVSTGQHRALLDQALGEFGLVADVDLDLMRPDQSLADSAARALTALDRAIEADRPALVLAQGDTTTVLAAALASYYRQVPFGHVEAGLRTGQPYRPFPEEKNRVVAAHLASLHFAPTEQARANLRREGIDPATIHLTGNTGIDALRWVAAGEAATSDDEAPTSRMILVTAHRRENFGAPLGEICSAIADLIASYPDLRIVFPVHPNPRVRSVVSDRLGAVPRVELVEPAGYRAFVGWMRRSFLILTDSGGVQEEGPSLGVPVLVLRDETERPEAVQAGSVRLVGPHRAAIVAAVARLCEDPTAYKQAATAINPYGDGFAAERIVRVIADRFGLEPPQPPLDFDPHWPRAEPGRDPSERARLTGSQ